MPKQQPTRTIGLLFLLLLLLAGCGNADETSVTANPTATRSLSSGSSLAGTYDVTGTNPNGTSYAGTLEITNDGDQLHLLWETGTTLSGTGMLMDDQLVVGWGNAACTVAGYRLHSDGTLEGQRLVTGETEPNSEQARRALGTRETLAGEYTVTGTDADGNRYESALTVTEFGALYQFEWEEDDTLITGIAIQDGNRVAVGWGDDECGAVLYEVGSNGQLRGVWGVASEFSTGTEEATRQ